jgi:hypothetical protein
MSGLVSLYDLMAAFLAERDDRFKAHNETPGINLDQWHSAAALSPPSSRDPGVRTMSRTSSWRWAFRG